MTAVWNCGLRYSFPTRKHFDKCSDHILVQIALPTIGAANDIRDLQLLQMDIAAQGGKDRVEDGDFAAYLEFLDVTHRLDHAVVLFNSPVLVMELLKLGLRKGIIGIGFRQEHHGGTSMISKPSKIFAP